jgi:CO/xanthine dehydrogenase FAD-binding subunit
MKPSQFAYQKPSTLDDALALIAANAGETKLLAGGQSLIPMMNFRVAAPEMLIDINGLTELDYLKSDGGRLLIGALTRHNTLAKSKLVGQLCPLIPQAYHYIAHETIRNRGTIGGNLSHADPASEMPAVMLALDAQMTLRSAQQQRVVPADAFFEGMFTTALQPDEMLVEIAVPVASNGQRTAFQEVSPRQGDFALCGLAIVLTVTGNQCSDVRIACCGIGDRAMRLRDVEAWLNGRAADPATAKACGDLAAQAVEPMSDSKASAEYRRQLIRVLTTRMLTALFQDSK